MKILLIGDIFSTSGREMIEKHLDEIRTKHGINFIVANGENENGDIVSIDFDSII